MNEEALNDAYKLFVNTGYQGTVEDFSALIDTNEEALSDAHKLFVETGYNGSIDDFSGLVKKKDQAQPSTESVSEESDVVTEEVQTDGGSESPTFQPKFKPESEAGSRYEQAGDKFLPNVVDGIANTIAKKEKALEELRGKAYTSNPFGMYDTQVNTEIAPQLKKAEDELQTLKTLQRQYKEKKTLIDAEYAAEQLGEGEAVKNITAIMDLEKEKEGGLADFLMRGISTVNPARSKQDAKEALELFATEKMKESAERVNEKQKAFETQAESLSEATNSALSEQQALYTSGQIDYDTYLANYAQTVEGYERAKAQIETDYAAQTALVKDYESALENLSIMNQYDDMDAPESMIKSFSNELVKTPRQIGGLLKATTPILEMLSQSPAGGMTFVSQEQYLDMMSPVTDFLTQATEAGLLRTDEDDTKANMIGEVSGQLAKIIPASVAAPVAGVAVSAGMSFDEMYQTALQGDVSEAEAVNMAAIYTPIGTALEYFGARTAVGAIDKKALRKIAFDIIKDKGLTKIGKKEAQIELKDGLFKQLGINMTREFFEEGTTEALQGMLQEGIKQAKNIQRGETVYEFNADNFIDNIKESFIYGGLAGAGAAGVSTMIGVGGKPKSNYEIYKETITNPNIYNKLLQNISFDNNLTDAQKTVAIETMNRDAETFRSVGKFDLSPEKQKQAVELLTRKKVLEKDIEGEDKAFTADIRKQIKAIDETLESFNAQVVDAPANPMQEAVQEQAEKVVAEQEAQESKKKTAATETNTRIEGDAIIENDEVSPQPVETTQEVRVESFEDFSQRVYDDEYEKSDGRTKTMQKNILNRARKEGIKVQEPVLSKNAQTSNVKMIPIDDAYEYKGEDRVGSDAQADSRERIDKLKDDIKSKGLNEPLIMFYQDGQASIIEGNHRIEALKELGYKFVPVEMRTNPIPGRVKSEFTPENVKKQVGRVTFSEAGITNFDVNNFDFVLGSQEEVNLNPDKTTQEAIAKNAQETEQGQQISAEATTETETVAESAKPIGTKPEIKMTFPTNIQLRAAKDVAVAVTERNRIKEQYKELKGVLDCLWKTS